MSPYKSRNRVLATPSIRRALRTAREPSRYQVAPSSGRVTGVMSRRSPSTSCMNQRGNVVTGREEHSIPRRRYQISLRTESRGVCHRPPAAIDRIVVEHRGKKCDTKRDRLPRPTESAKEADSARPRPQSPAHETEREEIIALASFVFRRDWKKPNAISVKPKP